MADLRRYVVDASVAAKWHLDDEEHTEAALRLFSDYLHSRVSLLAPDHLRCEVPSAIRKAVRRWRLDEQAGRSAIADFLSLRIPTVRSDSLLFLAYDESARYGCSFYDGLYLALAETAGSPLIYADDRLHNALAGRFPLSLWIEDYGSLQ